MKITPWIKWIVNNFIPQITNEKKYGMTPTVKDKNSLTLDKFISLLTFLYLQIYSLPGKKYLEDAAH